MLLLLLELGMPTYYMEYRQVVEHPREKVWNFFSQPHNLSRLSPKDAGVVIVSPQPGILMYTGIIVHLKMGPSWAPKLHWHSKITQIQAPDYFIDEQLSGPFAQWHHEHRFVAIDDNRTEIIDILHYAPPFGPIGALANWLFVRRQLEQVFKYRQEISANFDFSA
ncbi:MAG: SRPBCC family protein [Bacteroidota bacterium]